MCDVDTGAQPGVPWESVTPQSSLGVPHPGRGCREHKAGIPGLGTSRVLQAGQERHKALLGSGDPQSCQEGLKQPSPARAAPTACLFPYPVCQKFILLSHPRRLPSCPEAQQCLVAIPSVAQDRAARAQMFQHHHPRPQLPGQVVPWAWCPLLPPPPPPTHLHCKNTPAASRSQVGSPSREECGGFQLWHPSCAQPPGSTLLPCDFSKSRCVLRPGLWRGGWGMEGHGCPPEQPLSLSVKLLPAGSCGGGSRVDVWMCVYVRMHVHMGAVVGMRVV